MERKLKPNSEEFKNIYSREITLRDIHIDKENRTILNVVATETPAIVFDWYRFEPIREIIISEGVNVPEDKKVKFLDAHSRFSHVDVLGSTENLRFEKKYEELKNIWLGDTRISTVEEDVWTKIVEGHLDSTSIGYRISDKETVVLQPGETHIVKGREFKNDFEDNKPLYIRTSVELLENSLVPIGADQAAKFRSQFTGGEGTIKSEVKLSEDQKEDIKNLIDEEINKHKNKIQLIKTNEENKMNEPTVNELEQLRIDNINALAKEWKDKVENVNLEDLSNLYVQSGKSAIDFSDLILDNHLNKIKEAAAKPTVSITKNDVKNYSLTRAIAHVLDPGLGNCLELEISAEYAKESGRQIMGKGSSFFIPHNVYAGVQKKTQRATDVNTTATTGGEFVGTDHLGSEWIDVLRNKLVVQELGVTFLPGRKGDIKIPKLTTGNSFGWAATENAAVVEGDPVTTEITMSPKRGGTFVDISKQAIIQSDPALDIILTQDGRDEMARGFDAGVLHGSGAGGQFTGIENLTSVKNTSLASATWQGVLDAMKEIKAANAAKGELKWVTNAAAEAVLRGRPKESGQPMYIMSDDGRIAGRDCPISEQVNAGYMFLGVWNQAYMAFWDALDVTVDPFTKATTFQVRITFNQLADFAARYDESFYYASDLD